MQPTYIGLIAALIGVIAMSRSMTVMLMVVACSTIFGAAAAINASALGNASILPPVFLLAFLALRLVRSPDFLSHRMESALKVTALFAVFAIYGLISAFIYPRLFFHQIEIVPTRFVSTGIFYVAPLGPSPQNITQSTYLMGTYLMLVATVFVAATERRSRLVAMSMIGLCWAHVGFGVLDVLFNAANIPLLDFVRNANYAIVDQQIGGFHRIQGTFAETSAYSTYGFSLLVFVTELWLRQVEPKLTGWTTLALACALFFSTSTSAYVGLGVYALVLGIRMVYFPSTVGQRKALILAALAVLAVSLVLVLLVAVPAFVAAFSDILTDMTTGKAKSFSGIQRGFWNMKAWEAFFFSKGLGVGVGSFRSSSLISAIGGSMGVIGLSAFVLFCYRILPAHRMSIYRLDVDKTQAVGAAAAWAAVIGLAPAMLSASNPDPGLMFAFLAGVAIAWAPHVQRAPVRTAPIYEPA